MKKALVLAVALILPIPSFSQTWVARYNGPDSLDDLARAIAIDGSGNVYVTGYSDGGYGTYKDYATVKYNTNGVEQWARIYKGQYGVNDEARAIAVDDSGNVYVTGYVRYCSNGDYTTVKYNTLGVEQWVKTYNGPGNSGDGATAIAIDDSSNVYVTGHSWGAGTKYDCATVKYNTGGVEQWVARYEGHDQDYATAIAVDNAGNVYITGYFWHSDALKEEYLIVKYNTNGVEQWMQRYGNGPGNGDDEAYAIAVDGSGNVYVTGVSWDSVTHDDYATVKYNTNGVKQWVRRYNGPDNCCDEACAIAVDGNSNVYVTGYVGDFGTASFYATVKYNTDGVEQWMARYDGPSNYNDEARAIAVDNDGNVYVTGMSLDSVTSEDYATIKYNSAGDSVWVERYNGPANGGDGASAIAVKGGNVYVTGYSGGSGTGSDYATIKYSEVGVEESELRVESLELRVFPNPSFGNALIKYGLPEKASISLRLYDISGRLVKTIYSGTQEKGYYEVDIKQDELKGGIYFIRFETDKFKATRKLTILK